jgi:multidrug efflux pump subunit AcrA (membrane-fusion protein)
MDGDQEVVLVVVSDRVERRAVHVARESGQEVMITAGLSAGEPVIVEGPQDLADGDPVKEIRR